MKGKIQNMPDILDKLQIKPLSNEHNSVNDVKSMNEACLKLLKQHDAKFPQT